MKKRFLAIILCAMLTVMSLPQVAVTAFAEGIENTYESIKSAIAPRGTITASGYCGITSENNGENVKWSLDDQGTLTISKNTSVNGTDFSMKNYSSGGADTPWYSNRGSIKNVVIASGVTSVGDNAFYSCTKITSVSISNSVTSIGTKAFYYCTALTSIDIPGSVKSIGDNAFGTNSKLTSVNLNYGLTTLNAYAFANCNALTQIDIPSSVTSIPLCAFTGCSALLSVTIPNSVTSIGGNAFENCRSLSSITIPSGVKSIQWATFRGCSALTSINLSNSVTDIGGNAFANCTALTSIIIPSSVTSVQSSSFNGCTNLESIKFEGTTSTAFPSYISSIPTTATLYYPLGNANWENNIALSDDGKFMCNGTHEVATNAVAYVDGDNTTIDFLTANESSVLPIASQQSTKLFEGWFDGITASPSTLTAPASAFDGIYASDTPYQKVITANYRDLGTVSKDPSDNNQTGVNTQGEFDQFGVQIRLDTLAYPGLRFITSFGNQLLNELQALNNQDVKYGYVVGLKSKISQNISSTDKIVQGTKGTRTVDCTRYDNTSDHKNFTDYRIFSLVITYEEGTGKDDEIVARPYVTYKDAQGVTRTFYGEYTGTNVYGGCCTTYNIARKAIGEGNLNNGVKK